MSHRLQKGCRGDYAQRRRLHDFPAGKSLARNGYRTLRANPSRATESLDKKLLDVKACIEYLKSLPGVEHMVILGHSGGYECLASECIYEMPASEDKTLAFVEGASHMLFPAKECESFPGQFGDTVKTMADYTAAWLEAHF